VNSRVRKIIKDAVAPVSSVLLHVVLEIPGVGDVTEENVRHAGLSITDWFLS
jgi:hypothetical protein